MHYFECEDVNDAFIKVINKIKQEGKEIYKAQTGIKEIYPVTIKINNPTRGILYIKNRPYNPAFMVAETIWNLTGQTSSWLLDYNQKYDAYFTDGKLLAGYGNRIFNWKDNLDQIKKLVNLLQRNPFSQHGTIVIADPSFDLDNPKFVPCITFIKFKIRNYQLHMSTFMRAQDMWLGFPYDAHLLLSIFQLVAVLLEVEMGCYYHICDVARLYERDYQGSEEIGFFKTEMSRDICMELKPENAFESLHLYKDLVANKSANALKSVSRIPEYWLDSVKTCQAYRLIKNGDFLAAIDVINSINNAFKDQFLIWSETYYPSFHKRLVK